LAAELLVLRQAANFVGSTAAVSSIVIGIFLGAMTAGYFMGMGKLRRDPFEIASGGFLWTAALITLAASWPLVAFYFSVMSAVGITSPVAQTFAYSIIFLSAPPFLLGFNTAALSETLHDREKSTAGLVMGTGTIGSVLGSLVTTLIFMAVFGTNVAVVLTAALSLAGALVAQRNKRAVFFAAFILTAAAVVNDGGFLRGQYGIVSNNEVNTVAVLEGRDAKFLLVDSAVHSVISRDGKKYARYINFIDDYFIKTIPPNRIRNILVLGAGGFTVGHLDERNAYTFVDIDRALPRVAQEYFLGRKLGANKNFVLSDAGRFLRATDDSFDLIIMDVFSRWSIPEPAITTEFMSRMKGRLRSGGVIVMNTIAGAMFSDEFSKRLDNTIRTVFPRNLSRHIIGDFDGWTEKGDSANVLYIYRDAPNTGAIYTPSKNSTVYDK
jgi:predicted membrane-bound spermidine synthase